jgi:hypothetical protein
MRPDARQERLLIEEVGDELVVYDEQRHRAHRLNRAAALVWRSCDGRKTVADLKEILQSELNPAVDETLVWKALDRLGKANLLQEAVRPPAGMTRRQALGKFGQTAALALLVPTITSITAPTPLQAKVHFICEAEPCLSKCKKDCKSDKDCPSNKPFCVIEQCGADKCDDCTNAECVSNRSVHKKPHDLLGGGRKR